MLIRPNIEQTKLIKLKTTKPRDTSSRQTSMRRVIDDSKAVAQRMELLFTKYKWKVVTTEEELKKYLATSEDFGIDTETTGLDIFKHSLVGISLGTADTSVYIPLKHKRGLNYSGDISNIQALLKDKALYGFNAKFDLKAIKYRLGIDIEVKWCGYLGARLIDSSEPSNEMKAIYAKYIDPKEETYSFGSLFKNTFDNYDPLIVGAYASVDAMKHYNIAKWQMANIGKAEKRIMEKLELPLTHHLVNIELTGIELDLEWCKELEGKLQEELDLLKIEMERSYEGLNPASPKQVAKWLYDKLELPKINGRGTGEDTLRRLKHPLADKVLQYRKVQKLLSTYASKMPKEAYNGVVHCNFNQYGADTGRFSSSNPNMQNIPKDDDFRKMFRARKGHMLVSCDYSQQEVRILASLANDPSMIEAYARGLDFYAFMVSLVFERPYEQCVKGGKYITLRDQMKSIVLGLNYGMGLRAMADSIGKSVKETKTIYDRFYEKCPKVKEFSEQSLQFARKNGYVETVLGRKRRFTAIHKPTYECDNKEVLETVKSLKNAFVIQKLIKDAGAVGIIIKDNRRAKGVEARQVVNSIIQGSGADMTKLAMVQICENEKLKELGCKVLITLHDEIIAEFPDETAEEGAKLMAEVMMDVGKDLIGIDMLCEPQLMRSWRKD